MRLMVRRLRQLEKTFLVSAEDEAESELAALIRARRTRRLQMAGRCVPAETRPTQPTRAFQRNNHMTIADVLRHGRYGVSRGRGEDSTR
jgi:hypothetical protein